MDESETVYAHELKVGDKTAFGKVIQIKRGTLFSSFVIEDKTGRTHEHNWHMFASVNVTR